MLGLPSASSLFPRFRPREEHRPIASRAPASPHLRVRWLGTAGHVIETPGATLLIDPFLTRPSVVRSLGRPLVPATETFARWLPTKVDAILLGHSHYDHLLDAPAIALRTGALVVGSRTTASFARAAGVAADRIVEVPPEGRTIAIGDTSVRFVPSRHGRIFAGRVPLEGEVREPPPLPARIWDYRMGGAFGIHVSAHGRAVYHNGSADLVEPELAGLAADVVLLGLAGRAGTPDYVSRLTRCLAPRVLVPTHHDAFFAPLEDGVRLLPGIDLDGFFSDARRFAPSARLYTPTYDDVLAVPLDGDPRDAMLVAREPA